MSESGLGPNFTRGVGSGKQASKDRPGVQGTLQSPLTLDGDIHVAQSIFQLSFYELKGLHLVKKQRTIKHECPPQGGAPHHIPAYHMLLEGSHHAVPSPEPQFCEIPLSQCFSVGCGLQAGMWRPSPTFWGTR